MSGSLLLDPFLLELLTQMVDGFGKGLETPLMKPLI
jgi:hypothetical protein